MLYGSISRELASLISEEQFLYSDDGSRTSDGVCPRGVILVFRESKIESPTSAKRRSFYSKDRHVDMESYKQKLWSPLASIYESGCFLKHQARHIN